MCITPTTVPIVLLVVLLTLSGLSGCATVDQKIGLNYAPTDRFFGRHSGDITVSGIEAKNISKNSKGEWIIGSLNNVHGVHQADLLSDRSLGEWITEAMLLELKRVGYSVTYAAKIPSSTARAILVDDINSFLNINQGAVSAEVKQELKFNVDIFLNGFRAKTLTVASRDNKTLPLSSSKEDKEKILRQSLQDAIQQVIPEITALTDQQ